MFVPPPRYREKVYGGIGLAETIRMVVVVGVGAKNVHTMVAGNTLMEVGVKYRKEARIPYICGTRQVGDQQGTIHDPQPPEIPSLPVVIP